MSQDGLVSFTLFYVGLDDHKMCVYDIIKLPFFPNKPKIQSLTKSSLSVGIFIVMLPVSGKLIGKGFFSFPVYSA